METRRQQKLERQLFKKIIKSHVRRIKKISGATRLTGEQYGNLKRGLINHLSNKGAQHNGTM